LNQKQTKISALLITYNEEKHIVSAIKNIEFADEIIVVDGKSTDATVQLLEQFPKVKVISRAFKNFADQRNFAINQAKHHWILFIDADERIPKPLKHELLEAINIKNDVVAYLFKRRFFFNKKVIRYSGLQSDTTYRLFKKGSAKYDTSKLVHEQLIVNGKSRVLNNYMLHYCYTSNTDYKRKMEHYATLKAEELHTKGKQATPAHFIFRPVYKYITNYIFRLGFLDGKEGFSICYLSAYGVWYRYKMLKMLNKTKA
jgi:glycosyltransferase involved in cell wall biosynthesis